MERIVLKNGKEMEVTSITGSSGILEISFENQEFEELEEIFVDQTVLESIILTDENGTLMNTYKNYTNLLQITKKKGGLEKEKDTIIITLEQESYLMKEIRKLQDQILLHDGGIKELGQIVGLHDGAIEELGSIIGEFAEEGENV